MRRVIIESPYTGNISRNVAYAQAAVRDCVNRGETAYASHLIFPGALDDNTPRERNTGILCGYAWWDVADTIAFYVDLGWSSGMVRAFDRARDQNRKWEIRHLENFQYSGDRPTASIDERAVVDLQRDRLLRDSGNPPATTGTAFSRYPKDI